MKASTLDVESNPRVQTVKEEMSVFLGLLQKSISTSRDNILIETESDASDEYIHTKRLSVILSASEGLSEGASSEQAKKQLYYEEVSMNEFGSSSLEDNFIRPLIRKKTDEALVECTSSVGDCTPSTTGKINDFDQTQTFCKENKGESFGDECNKALEKKNQQQLLEYLKGVVKDSTNYIAVLEKRNNENLLKKEKYRTKCQHLFRAFVTGREEEKRLLQEYIIQKEKIEKLEEIRAETELARLKISKDLQLSRSQNQYLKELIFIANKNYENLENKYLESEERFKYSEIAMKQKEIHYMEGNSVLKDVILKLGKDKDKRSPMAEKSPSAKPNDKEPTKSRSKSRDIVKEKSREKENKENRSANKHKPSKSVPPHQYPHSQQISNKHEQLDDAYRRMFIRTLRGN